MKRLFIAGGLVSGLVLACSADPAPAPPISPSGGSTAQGGGGSGGSTAGTGGTGGATAGTAGTAGATGGSAGAAGGSACNPACTGGQVCSPETTMCICPPYNPDHCPAAGICTDFTEDPDHCGTCDTVCGTVSACSAGLCTPDPTEVLSAAAGCGKLVLSLVGPTLYVLNTGAGTISSVPVAGGAATELVTGLTGATSFAIDATNFYVATGMSLSRVALAGGAIETVVTETTTIHDVTVQDDVLYYPTGNNVKSVAADATDGTPAVVGLAESSGEPQSVAVDGDLVFWGASVAYNVEVDSITTDAVVKLGASQGDMKFGAGALQTDGTRVFWMNGSNVESRIYDASTVQDHIADSLDSDPITAFTFNATTAYFGAGGNIEKAAFGEDGVWMARGQGEVLSMALDATSVYWSNDACKIFKAGL